MTHPFLSRAAAGWVGGVGGLIVEARERVKFEVPVPKSFDGVRGVTVCMRLVKVEAVGSIPPGHPV